MEALLVLYMVNELLLPGHVRTCRCCSPARRAREKTELAAYLADRLDRPLAVKRVSDLFSAWIGDTEARIAAAFADAREKGAVLLFDEADSLLHDRADAQSSWEVAHVNEMLI